MSKEGYDCMDMVDHIIDSRVEDHIGIGSSIVQIDPAPRVEDLGIKDIEARILKMSELEAKHDQLKKEAAQVWHEYEEVQLKLAMDLEALELDSIKTSVGNFSFKDVQSYKVPKDDFSREKFFSYLKERGVFDNLITVNSMTLNSWAKQEEQIAIEQGKFDFSIPGIQRGEVTRKFSLTQTRRKS